MAQVLVIDPGHGPGSPGAYKNKLKEHEISYDVAVRVGRNVRLLTKAGDINSEPRIKTVFTRGGDDTPSIDLRAYRARQAVRDNGPGILLVVHNNSAAVNMLARGAEVLVSPDGAYKQMSSRIGTEILERLAAVGMKNRGVKPAKKPHINHNRLGILAGTHWHMPGLYLELGFLSNKRDAALLGDPEGREVMAIAIAGAIIEDGFGLRPRWDLLSMGE